MAIEEKSQRPEYSWHPKIPKLIFFTKQRVILYDELGKYEPQNKFSIRCHQNSFQFHKSGSPTTSGENLDEKTL
jgi:hypothetical protein